MADAQTPPAQPIAGTADELVATVMDFFSTRLLLKRFRRPAPTADADVCVAVPERPAEVERCEEAFRSLATTAVLLVQQGEELDALEWLEICDDFTEGWAEVCHWISPRKLREFFSTRIGAQWRSVDAVPAERERPPRELSWYKKDYRPAPQPHTCETCGVVCNSTAQYHAHLQGAKHRTPVRGTPGPGDVVDGGVVPPPPQDAPPAEFTGKSRRRRRGAKKSAEAGALIVRPEEACLQDAAAHSVESLYHSPPPCALPLISGFPDVPLMADEFPPSALPVAVPYDAAPSTCPPSYYVPSMCKADIGVVTHQPYAAFDSPRDWTQSPTDAGSDSGSTAEDSSASTSQCESAPYSYPASPRSAAWPPAVDFDDLMMYDAL